MEMANLSLREVRRQTDWVAIFVAIKAQTKNRVAFMKEIARRTGIPYSTINNKYHTYVKPESEGGGARSLIDRRKISRARTENPWGECYMYFIEKDKNTSMGGYRAMIECMRSGNIIPIINKTWMQLFREDPRNQGKPLPERCPDPLDWLPIGATYENLQERVRHHPHYQFNVLAARKGLAAARKYVRTVLTTREGLPVGAKYEFDDVWHNIDVRLTGIAKPVQPLEFAGYDIASGFKAMSCMKPRFVRDDGTRDNLKEQQFRWALANLLIRTGFYAGGVDLVIEHGTTQIREKVEKQIRGINGVGELIHFSRSGILSEQLHAGLFIGDVGGNFRRKAFCEGGHNVLHNREASLIGNRGRDAAHMHESQKALVRYEEKIADIAKRLPLEFQLKIRSNLLSFEEYVSLFQLIEARLMDDFDHRLEGFGKKTVTEWRLSENDTWKPFDELMSNRPERANMIATLIGENPNLTRIRQMSRREAWESGKAELEAKGQWLRIDDWYMPYFMDTEKDGRWLKVRPDGRLGFRDEFLYGKDEMLYRATVRSYDGWQTDLTPGERVLAIVNPFMPEKIWIMNQEDGRIRGTCTLDKRAPVYDKNAILLAMGDQAHDLAKKVLPARGRHQAEAERRAARMAENERVIKAGKAALSSAPTFDQIEAADVMKLTDEPVETPPSASEDEPEEESFLARMNGTH